MKKIEILTPYLKALREEIITAFESIEPKKKFSRTPWQHKEGGGGEIGLLRGDVFEKAAVNFSCVSGAHLPFQESSGPFTATGVSLITHMQNPHAPTVHFNIRYIETENKSWFGGGYDLTPMGFSYDEDANHFHHIAKKAVGENYPLFSQQAKEYFFIPHRKKERGVGGIFFDHFNTGDWEADLKLWKEVGNTFLEGVMPIYKARTEMPYSEEDKASQNRLRAHYVEFNLLYDRGTKFGFQSGGHPEAILCSMPPTACW